MSSNIIPFRRPGTHRVIVWYGWGEDVEGSGDFTKTEYFVEIDDGRNTDEVVWAGDTYEEALRVAAAVAADGGGLPIIDEVAA